MDVPLATLRTGDGRPVVTFVRRLAHPAEKVWRAVTDPAEMAHWFPASIETELKAGAPMRFSFGDDKFDLGGAYADGEILEFDPPKVYAFWWANSVLRFELLPEGAGCRLVFTYTLSGEGTAGDLASLARTAPGWDVCLAAMAARLDGHPPPRVDATWVLARAERYVEEFGLGEGEVRDHRDGYLVWFERDLVQPPEQVWAALTETGDAEDAETGDAETGDTETGDTETGGAETGELAVGRAPDVRFTNGYVPAGPVTEVEPPRLLEYAWQHDGAPVGRVRFELRHQEPIGTRLVVTQTLPPTLADLRATALAAWQTHLELLFAALHGDVRCPWPADRTAALRAMYAARLG